MRHLSILTLVVAVCSVAADGPGDNLPDKVRPIPPGGIKVADADRKDLAEGLKKLGDDVASLQRDLTKQPVMARLIPDVEVFHKAVRYALELDQFYTPGEVKLARQLLAMGQARAQQLRDGKPAFAAETGLVLRGFRSRIDGSVQPYGLVVPSTPAAGKSRLDVWLHGRFEKVSEVTFLGQRMRDKGQFTPPGAIVLHPFGRYSNAFKFAGEIDVLEAIEHVKQNYPIDEDRVVMRGFSMGGAGCWQFAVHYPDRWVAAAPGAGFSETPRFLDVFQKEKLAPPEYERKLWRLYDCDGYAANLANLPTVAYSGEKDKQKQAADVMAVALAKENIDLVHVIGAKAGHNYTPQAREEIDRRIDRITERGRDRVPSKVRLVTYTLRYNRSYWVTIDRMGEHWKKASVNAWMGDTGLPSEVHTENVEAFTLDFAPADARYTPPGLPLVFIDKQGVRCGPVRSDRSWQVQFVKQKGRWVVSGVEQPGLAKRHRLQGPIDDAFMDSFLNVRPTGKGWHEKTAAWAKAEMAHAADQWRRQFRGDAREKDDKDVTDADIAAHNLVLWGDAASNAVLAKVLPKLPVGWDARTLTVAKAAFDASHHVPVLIYPNPLNPKKYVVLNSGFTFREYDQLNNARQVPKLPDYAVIDVNTPPSSRYPGKVALADFFDEGWRLPK